MKNKVLLALVAAVLVTILYKAVSFSPELVSFSGPTMGTTYTVKYTTTADAPSREQLKSEVDSVLLRINKLMSTYDPTSELSEFNKQPAGTRVTVSDDLAYVLGEALNISELTGGKYDVTVGPLVNLWGFGPGAHNDQVPTENEIVTAQEQVGYHYVKLDGNELTKSRDVYVDLSSIAKGYGVDEVARTLQQSGISNYLVEVGGEILVSGRKLDGSSWAVGVESPAGGHNVAQRVISAKDIAIATSGDYRNYFEENGVRYSHTIDPTTGKPITHRLVSVTVIDSNATRADGLATAITVLGPEDGLKFAQENDIAAYLLVKEDFGFAEQFSEAFEAYLTNN
ncbi:Thiamine biosynthesis lipoprotein ApbE precursor [Marinomonas aquimarina]|uniref:FAD:protein FMN transferase n=1 Tax=Marinomonas aquimarina TaxID=295068 RepID=A0A1A8TEK3_9GAMM|nr:FAD:protein FMN transferase [Marinomonas aquimarina]SBS30261.1 Thiamine biosynthesis lipoprotein ApbE precursor [Marinomonas aquimarina]